MGEGESREFTRVATTIEVEFAGDNLDPVTGVLGDVSMKGLFLFCALPPPVGTSGTISLYLGQRDTGICISARGRVVRHAPDGVGIEIREIGLDSYGHLRNLVQLNAADTDAVQHEFDSHVGLRRRT